MAVLRPNDLRISCRQSSNRPHKSTIPLFGLGEGDARELFRRLLEQGMQDLIDAELTAAIGAEPHERTESRINQRNGSRTRLLSTPAGDVELRIPKVRVGSFFPSLLEPRRRVDKALWAVIMALVIALGAIVWWPVRALRRKLARRRVDARIAAGVDTGVKL